MNGAAINSGMGTCGMCGPIGVITGWFTPSVEGVAAIVPTAIDWIGLVLVSVVLPAVICPLINLVLRKIKWVKEGDLKLG